MELNARPSKHEPIAIVGIGCRFPGAVNSPQQFWELLRGEVEAILEIPASRMDLERFFDDRPATPGKIMSRWGGYLDDIDRFDAYFFGVAPVEAERLDPQQRLLLEVGWEALADAGQPIANLAGSDTGVFVGMWLNDFEGRLFKNTDLVDFYMTTGSGRYAASGRLSFFFGFQGPSITIDTACSSSLVSVHLACQSLRQGDCRLALAGGANTILQPHITIAYSQSKMMAPDGHCKFGDHRADGYVRSEGAGLVVLKRLSDAIADGDRVYAVIQGSAVNNDGRSGDYLATPSQAGQMEMLRRAYQNAGITPDKVQYIEAHGTGTRAGDPVEIGAIGQICSVNRPADQPLFVGSVKTNLGHTEGAAGVAGLIKIALAVYHRHIPASLHLEQKNPAIPWDAYKLDIPQTLTPWPAAETAVAGVSAFGIAGTNAHIVVSEAPSVIQESVPVSAPFILPLSAQTPEALRAVAQATHTFLARDDAPDLADLLYTTAVRSSHLEQRLALVADDKTGLQAQLAAFLADEAQPGVVTGKAMLDKPHKVVFVFPGQGAQWLGMGRELCQREPVFRETLTRCEAAMRPFVDWSLEDQLLAEPEDAHYRLDQIDVIQPVLLALEIAFAELWRTWGVLPDAVIGHSMGEVAAAFIAGAITLDDAMRIICRRSQLMRRTSGQGAMAVVELTAVQAQQRLAGRESQLSIAVSNSPRSTVVAGETAALDVLLAELEAEGIFCRKVKVDVASHSPQMEPLQPELRALLADVQPQAGHTPIYATSQAHVTDGADMNADFWVANLRQPVQFAQMVEQLLAADFTIFIEMSPHPILLPAVQQVCAHVGVEGVTLASTRRDEPEPLTLLAALGQLYTVGYPVDWARRYPSGQVVSLPTYPWQRELFWYEPPDPVASRAQLAHPFLDDYLLSATGEHLWEGALSLSRFAYLADHRVGDTAVFPAAGFIEMLLAAAQQVYPDAALAHVALHEALPLTDDACQVQLILKPDVAGTAVAQFFSRPPAAEEWTLHATAQVPLNAAPVQAPILPTPTTGPLPAAQHYRATAVRGLPYGPAFQGVQQLWTLDESVLGELALPEAAAAGASGHLLPSSLLDAAFQLLLATLPASKATYLPVSVDKVWLNGRFTPEATLVGYAVPQPTDEGLQGDIFIFADGQLLLAATGLHMQPLREQAESVADWMYTVTWEPQPLAERPLPTFSVPGQWLIFADAAGLGQQLAERLRAAGEWVHLLHAADLQAAKQPLAGLSDERPLRGILHLWSLDKTDPTDDADLLSVLHLVQALGPRADEPAPRLWLFTRDAVAANSKVIGVAGAPLWGLGRVLDHEHPELSCQRVDLATAASLDDIWAELWANGGEREVALRSDGRFVSRLVPFTPQTPAEPVVKTAVPGQPYRVTVTEPGILDNLHPLPLVRRQPEPGEVELEVRATGLNFMNVMAALGALPGYENGVGPLGIECAGVVTAVAPDITQFKVGDAVMGIAFDSLSSHAITDARLLVAKPEALTFAEAASLPIVFLTAYYALCQMGRMRAGERVLIHAGTGGVGQAAIQLAQHVGAEILATAGTPEKRAFLRDQGISHVMDSRSLAFADEVLAATSGAGVDLLLNSLAGEAVLKGLEILRPYGRFLEIGKRDIYDNSRIGLLPFQKNLSYFAIDLDRMSRERPAEIGEMLQALLDLFEAGAIRPLPIQEFPAAQVSDAFRFMAQARHIGKIVVTQAPAAPAAEQQPDLDRATYLITGGLGALGLLTARWLAERAPCDLVLLSRRPPNDVAQAAIAELEQLGARVQVRQADVTDRDELQTVLAEMDATRAPLRGVVHAAGVLADGTLAQMDAARFRQALAPKVRGAWHLHTLTEGRELGFFVLYSSATALLGTPGQGNYAAGNAFLDALAHHRQARGLPGLSINWGPWAEVGLAAADTNRGDRLAFRGLGSITAEQGIAALAQLLAETAVQVAVMPFDLALWQEFYPAARDNQFFAALAGENESGGGDTAVPHILAQLQAAEPGRQRTSVMANHVRDQVAQVLRLATERIPFNKPLKTLGIDSLMTLELRNRLETSLGLTLSATLIWNYPTIDALVPFLAEKCGVSLDVVETAVASEEKNAPDGSDVPNEAVDTLDDLSQADVEALLADELSEIDELLKGF